MNEEEKRYSLLRLIVTAGLEEDFINWLGEKGYHDIYGRLDNIPPHLVEEYVSAKKLLDTDIDKEILRDIYSIDYDDRYGYIKAKRHTQH
jgi:hypothetical protein